MKRYFVFILASISLFGFEGDQAPSFFHPYKEPWLTGPLLAPSGNVAELGRVNIQTYFDMFVKVAKYNENWKSRSTPNFYNIRSTTELQVGVLPRVDVHITPIVSYRETMGQHSVYFGDMPFSLNIQVYRPNHYKKGPHVKVGGKLNFPTGKYNNLTPGKRDTDATGSGCWYPGPRAAISKFWHITGQHFLEWRWGAEYRFGVPVSIKGVSSYGGDSETKGSITPGDFYRLVTAFQYTIKKRWAMACDLMYTHFDRDHFSGKTTAPVGENSGEQISLAPALEYNWSSKVGLIGGVWFSLAGRNRSHFINGIISCNISI